MVVGVWPLVTVAVVVRWDVVVGVVVFALVFVLVDVWGDVEWVDVWVDVEWVDVWGDVEWVDVLVSGMAETLVEALAEPWSAEAGRAAASTRAAPATTVAAPAATLQMGPRGDVGVVGRMLPPCPGGN